MFGNAEAIQADVIYRTNYAQFEGDQQKIRAAAEQTFGALDAGTLKAALASEKYDRALARSKGSSYAVAKATAAYKSELAALETSENRAAGGARRHAGALQQEERSLGGVARGALAGSGLLGRMGRAAIFASTSLLGGYGLIYAFRATIRAARDQEVALAHLQVAVTDTGLNWTDTKGRVEDALGQLVKTTAFTRDDLTEALATAVRRFGDVHQALSVTATAADVSRAKNISLTEAMQLLIRASFGQSRAAKALGVDVAAASTHLDQLRATTAHATAAQIANAKAADQQANRTAFLDAIQARYHGNAAKYLQTSAGKQQLFNAELRDSEEIIGQALLPTLNHYLGSLSGWLDKMNKSGRLQRDVNHAVHDAKTAIHDADIVVTEITGHLGGFKNTLELLLALKVASKFASWGTEVGLFGGSLRRVASAEKAVAEANVAADVTAIGGAAAAASGEVSGLRAALLSLGNPATLIALAAAGGAFAVYKGFQSAGKHLRSFQVRGGLLTQDTESGNWSFRPSTANRGPTRPHGVTSAQAQQLLNDAGLTDSSGVINPEAAAKGRRGRGLATPIAARGPSGSGASGRSGDGGAGAAATGGLPYGLQNALLEAQATPGSGDDLRALNDELGYLNKALAQKGLTPAQWNQLLQERNDVLSQRDQIVQDAARARKQAADAEARKRKQHFTGLTVVPAVLVKRLANAETKDKPVDVVVGLMRQEQAALRRQAAELRREGAPESYQAKIAKEIEHLHHQVQAELVKGRRERIAKLDAVPVGLKLEEANAIANGASQERLVAIYRKEKAALDKQLAALKAIHATKAEILKNRQAAAALEKKIKAGSKPADVAASERQAIATLQEIIANSSNIALPGSTHVTVNQHFPQPPTEDGRREAIMAHHATLGSWAA